jgi:hypothetical protein
MTDQPTPPGDREDDRDDDVVIDMVSLSNEDDAAWDGDSVIEIVDFSQFEEIDDDEDEAVWDDDAETA